MGLPYSLPRKKHRRWSSTHKHTAIRSGSCPVERGLMDARWSWSPTTQLVTDRG